MVPALPNTLAREELTPVLLGTEPKSEFQAEGIRDPLKHQVKVQVRCLPESSGWQSPENPSESSDVQRQWHRVP